MIYLVDIESLPTRYTCEWAIYVPQLLKDSGFDVTVISTNVPISNNVTPGMFLNFSATNIYKSQQVEKIARLFDNGQVKDGDYFLFTDAWHPGVINLKYMADLLGVKIKIGGLWHAGSYDPWDGLGRLIGDTPWVRHAEHSFFNCYDHNYFATDFHINMFIENEMKEDVRNGRMGYITTKKMVRTGWPMTYMVDTLAFYQNLPKRNLILFPHRIAPEKQVEIFRDLAKELPQYEFVVCQDNPLTKNEYHTLLGQSKMIFSCSLQETLGIGLFEGAIVNAMPICPDALSYTEMYQDQFKYPSEWALNWDSYLLHKEKLVQYIGNMMANYETIVAKEDIKQQATSLLSDFFSADVMIQTIKTAFQR